MTLSEIKEQLRQRLIDHDGDVAPYQFADLIAAAKEIGLSEGDIARLVPEIDKTINWPEVKRQKEEAAAKAATEQSAAQSAGEDLRNAPMLLDALIQFCFSDGVVDQRELAQIFARADALQQDSFGVSMKIKSRIDAGGFRPYPNAKLDEPDLRGVLMSTSWYDPENFRRVAPAYAPAEAPPAASTALQPPRINLFIASKSIIRKGEPVELSWDASGVSEISISGIGTTRTLQGKHTVRPVNDVTYTLLAGGVSQSVHILIQKKSRPLQRTGLLLLILIFLLLLRTGCMD